MTVRDRNGAQGSTLSSVFADWRGTEEQWLLVSPHDDDVILGAGLLLLQAAREEISTTVSVVTDGRMGYCRLDQQEDIVAIRRGETDTALAMLGTTDIRRLEYPDCDLDRYTGRRSLLHGVAPEKPDARGGHTGLQNSLTACLRDIRPTRVFVPTGADLHPDHKAVHRELLISLFHASDAVWPELGRALTEVPRLYEMAIYSDFPAPPTVQLAAEQPDLDTKLASIKAFESQEQIDALVRTVRNAGPFEYFREVPFSLYDSRHYAHLFEPDVRATDADSSAPRATPPETRDIRE